MNDVELDSMIARVRNSSKLFDGDHVLRDAPMTDTRIAELELQRNIVLDWQFRRFLKTYGAGDFLYSWVDSFDPESEWSLWRQSQFVDGIGQSILPFSDNGCGDYYVFMLVDGKCTSQVYWLDHEQGYTLAESEHEDFNSFIVATALKS